MTEIDIDGLTPEQVASLTAAIAQAKEANAKDSPEEATHPEPGEETAPTEAEAVAEPVADGVQQTDPVSDLLARLRLEPTGSQVGAVVDWLTEHGLKL